MAVAEKHPRNLIRFAPAEGSDLQALAEVVRFQIAHSAWALGEILRCARGLPAAAVEQDLGIGPGSLRVNLGHTIEAMFYFSENFAGRRYDPAIYEGVNEKCTTLAGLAELLDSTRARLRDSMLTALAAGDASSSVLWENAAGGSLPLAVAIAQVFDHSSIHRAQAVNMLKRLGVTPVPDLDPMTFRATGLAW